MKIIVFGLALSLLLSGMLVAVGGEAIVCEESMEKEMEGTEVESSSPNSESITQNNNKNYTEINDWRALNNISDDLDGHYELVDPGEGELTEENDGYDHLVDTEEGWYPIGDSDEPFTGTFNGNNTRIRDLYIDRPTNDTVGLFGAIGEGAEVTNLTIYQGEVTGEENVGGLVGDNNGNVTNSYVEEVEVNGEDTVGGLVGQNSGNILNSSAAAEVTGEDSVGGLSGVVESDGWINNSHAEGDVSGDGDELGGLIGSNSGKVYNSSAEGDVSGIWGSVLSLEPGSEDVGGLLGKNDGIVNNSYATGNVGGYSNVGGFVGDNDGTISNSSGQVM